MMKSLITKLSREIENIRQQVSDQQEVARNHERFAYITRVMNDCIWDWDLSTGKIYRAESFTALCGYSREDLQTGENWWFEKIHPEDRERVIEKIKQALTAGENDWYDEYRFLCSDGQYKHLADKAYFVYENGKPVRGVGVVQDMTVKKKRQADQNKAIIHAQEKERGEISKELHENVSQMLSSVSVLLGYLTSADQESEASGEEGKSYLEKSQHYLKQAIAEIRKISYTLDASLIQEVGLQEPVEEITEHMRQQGIPEVHLNYSAKLEKAMHTEQKLAIYRIIQEQTNNILQHAKAGKVTISLTRKMDQLYLSIQDDGIGFHAGKYQGEGVGLINIRNRVEAFHGTIQIKSAPGEGCCLEVKMPVERE
jgi:PAS domain S-box-containing protein